MIAAQLKHTLDNDIPEINDFIKCGNLKIITKWLKKNIHSFGNSLSVNELLEKVSGQKLNVHFYKNHLKKRYLN